MRWLALVSVSVGVSSLACGRGDAQAPTIAAAPSAPDVTSAPAVAAETLEPRIEDPPDVVVRDVGKAELMGWVVLAPEQGGFRLELPIEPTYAQNTVQGSAGLTTQMRQWNASDSAAGTFFVVAIAPLVEQLVQHGDSNLALDRVIQSVGNAGGMRVDTTREITLDGFAGRQADVTIAVPGAGEAKGRVRLYLVGLRLYQLIGAWSDDGGHTQVEKFFASFALDDDVVDIATDAVDLWRRFPAPGDALDLELPGAPDRSSDRRDTPFGPAQVDSATLLSRFPPAVYGVVVTPLGADDARAPVTSLFDRWQASLDMSGLKREKVMVLGQPARRLTKDGIGWLVFVHAGSFYELRFQPVVAHGAGHEPAGAPERERFFASPRVLPAHPEGAP